MIALPIVHAVTDSNVILRDGFVSRAMAVMRALGPRGALHLRSSKASSRQFYDIALALSRVQKATGCWLIVNDRIDIAASVGANGVQLASHSLDILDALAVAPHRPVGASVHTVEEARAAEATGASWCVAGTVFETPSHAGRPAAKVSFIEEVAAAVSIPVIAIGGVMPDDVRVLIKAGAHGVATIRGAAWDLGLDASSDSQDIMETRLSPAVVTTIPEPVTRYISAYDSESGSGRNNHADGQRRSQGAGAE